VHVDHIQPAAPQPVPIGEVEDLTVLDRRKLIEVGEKIENDLALPQRAKCDLLGDQGVAADFSGAKKFDEVGLGLV